MDALKVVQGNRNTAYLTAASMRKKTKGVTMLKEVTACRHLDSSILQRGSIDWVAYIVFACS